METLYNWLLGNTENAGNYYTVLNTHRAGPNSLEIMARSSDFRIVNLFIHDMGNTDLPISQSSQFADKTPAEQYVFSNEQQVIAYLTEGKTADSQHSENTVGIRLLIAEPGGEVGDIAFPPAQA